MGLANAPATFQRAMDQVLGGLKFVCVLIYIDDAIIFSSTWEQHLRDLEAVFHRLTEYSLFVKPNKCSFGANSLLYLGHVVTADGLKPSDKHIEAVKNFPVPRTKTQLKSFLGLASFNRSFIPNFAKVTDPLRNLLRDSVPPDLTEQITAEADGSQTSRTLWDLRCDAAFKRVKHALTTAPLLSYPDWTQGFTLRTDASYAGLGAVLRQGDKVIAYLSRGLSDAESFFGMARPT